MPPIQAYQSPAPSRVYTLTQPSGPGAGEAGSQLDLAGRGSGMQMILTSFLEVWGLSPAEERQEVVGKSRVQKPCPPEHPLDLPVPAQEPRTSPAAGCYSHSPFGLACSFLTAASKLLAEEPGQGAERSARSQRPPERCPPKALPSPSPQRADPAKREAGLCG